MIEDNTRPQENTTPETRGLTATAGCGIEKNPCSFLLSAVAGRCSGWRRHYCFDDQVFTSYRAFLETVFDEPVKVVLTQLYRNMSVADIQSLFAKHLGVTVGEGQILRIMKDCGIQRRNYAERKRLSWKQGKMDASMAKSRQSRKQTFLLGSKVEKTIRYLLREALLVLEIKWDVVIGDNLQHILGRYEVDIPVVVVDRPTGTACRFAVEVDNSFTHSSPKRKKRDAAKDRALEQAGWRVFRLNGGVKNQDALAVQVADLVLAIEAHAEEIFVNHSFSSGSS
jgi:very-short-patch-repair endonuclease